MGEKAKQVTNLGLACFAGTLVSCVGTGSAESAECLELALLGGDFAGCLGRVCVGEGDGGTSGGGSEVVALKCQV
jgi:hypothetical protein